jgi:hypothetical protein
MEEGEKKPDAGTIPGGPQKKIMYAVLAIAVVILAVVLIAKFGFNTDLLNPAGGQMSLVQRPPLTVITMVPPVRPITSGIVRLPACTADQTYCNGECVYLMTDSKNCGTCGFSCGAHFCMNVTTNNGPVNKNCNSCINGNCIYEYTCEGVVCSEGYSCCKGRCVSNAAPNCGY